MKRLFLTCKKLTEGRHLAYLLQLFIQIVQVFFSTFSIFLTKVLIDAIQGITELEKADAFESFVIFLITGGRGNEFLMENRITVLPVALLISTLITAFLSFARMSLRSYAIAYMNGAMQRTLFTHLTAVDYPFYKTHDGGDLIQTCTRDVDVLRRFMIGDVSNFNYSFWTLLFVSAILFNMSYELALACLGLLPVMLLYSFFLMKKVRRLYRATDDSEGRMTERINENLASVRLVRAYGSEKKECENFERYLDDYAEKFTKWRRWSSFFFASSDIFAFGSNALALGVGVYLAYLGKVNASTIVVSFLFVNMIVWPLRQCATSLSNMGQYLASSDRLRVILDAQEEDRESGITDEIRGDITFEHVSFHYENDEKNALNDVSFHIPAGSTVAIMGKTGSGKSTLSLLLTRLYEPTSGQILLDDKPLSSYQKKHLRKEIVPVLQDPFLFSKTIEENILLARKEASREELYQAARTASIDDTIRSFKEGYATPVGEKGMSLSGGQKQRVAMARTLITDAHVYIFDDSLSAVDTETDRKIRANLRKKKGDSTIFIITHRVATAQDADLILVLEDGKLTEMGTHEELLEKPGLYQRIAEIQRRMA